MMNGFAHAESDVDFGTGDDPNDTFTTSATTSNQAGQIVPMIWYVPDNIYIDAVYSLDGADSASGDTRSFHLKSYNFNSGSTSCLTGGTLLAHSTPGANAGAEQAYLQTWSMDSNTVAGGKVVLAFFEQTGINSNYSISVKVKYHIV